MSDVLEWFKGITPGGIGIWTLVGTVVVALIRQKPIMQRLTDGREGNLLTERANEMSRLREEIAEVKAEARRASEATGRLENMVACMRPAISLLTAEVRRLDPENETNAALIQVGELMAMAAAGDMGFSRALVGLAASKGRGE